MPELPDVEAFRRVLVSCAQGRRLQHVEVRDAGVLHGVGVERLRRELEGHSFTTPQRYGKWLLAPIDGDGTGVLLHFGMTGMLVCADPADPADPPAAHDRITFTVQGRQLRYRDQRKLKGLWLADEDTVERTLSAQGPDAADLDQAGFTHAVANRRGGVKSALTDQSVLAGLGNLLADEILWRARLHPATPVRDLSDGQLSRLHREMDRTLRSAVHAGRVPDRPSWLTGHREGDHPACPRCGNALSRHRVAGRGTLWCPHCQPER